MLRVKQVEYLCEYKLKIVFTNGKVKVVDFEDWVFQNNFYLKPLRDIPYFKKVHLDDSNYSICWPNGADFSPDVLYEMGKDWSSKRSVSRPKKVQKAAKRQRKARASRLK